MQQFSVVNIDGMTFQMSRLDVLGKHFCSKQGADGLEMDCYEHINALERSFISHGMHIFLGVENFWRKENEIGVELDAASYVLVITLLYFFYWYLLKMIKNLE